MTSTGNAINVLRATYPRGKVSTGCAVEQHFEDYGREAVSSGGAATAIVKRSPCSTVPRPPKPEFDAIKAGRSSSADGRSFDSDEVAVSFV